MERHLKHSDVCSLKDITLRRNAVILCSNPTAAQFVANVNFQPGTKENRESKVQGFVLPRLNTLSLPKSIVQDLFNGMKPVCREIPKWINFHEKYLNSHGCFHDLPVEQYLCWTGAGTVDYQKTAIELIRHKILDTEKLYKLACLYCLRDKIEDLMRGMSEEYRSCFYNGDISIELPEIVVVWTNLIEGQVNRLDNFFRQNRRMYSNFYQYLFESVAVKGYKCAAKYFFQRLTVTQRLLSVQRTAYFILNYRTFDTGTYAYEYQKLTDVLFYLFALMSEEQRMEVLRNRPFEVLKCCLDWPHQAIFVDIAELAFPYLKQEEYSRLMFILLKNLRSGCNYPDIFRKFFLGGPKRLKDYARITYGNFIQKFFTVGDVETVRFIFRNMNSEDKVGLALSISGLDCCFDLFRRSKWPFVDMFLQEALSSKRDKIRFLISFVNRYASWMKAAPGIWAADECINFVRRLTGRNARTSNRKCSKCDNATQVDFPPNGYFGTHSNGSLMNNPSTEHLEQKSFRISPKKLKDYAQTRLENHLREFINIEDFESMKLLLRNLHAAERRNLALSDAVLYCCCKLFREKKWNSLQWFVLEALPTRRDRVSFLIAFLNRHALQWQEDICLRFIHWLLKPDFDVSLGHCSEWDKATQIDFPPCEYSDTHSDSKLEGSLPVEEETLTSETLTENLPIGHFEIHPEDELVGLPPKVFRTHPDEERTENPRKKQKIVFKKRMNTHSDAKLTGSLPVSDIKNVLIKKRICYVIKPNY